MLLVSVSVRGRGVGTQLMRHALDHLTNRQVTSVRLDATPLGQPIYEKLGFQPQYTLRRFAGKPQSHTARSCAQRMREQHERGVAELDAGVVGYDRRRLLKELHREATGRLVLMDQERLSGYLLMRAGRIATQVGPAVAPPRSNGQDLFAQALQQLAGSEVFVDIPCINEPATNFALRAGLRPARDLLRMCRGRQVIEQTECLWASSGPEKG